MSMAAFPINIGEAKISLLLMELWQFTATAPLQLDPKPFLPLHVFVCYGRVTDCEYLAAGSDLLFNKKEPLIKLL